MTSLFAMPCKSVVDYCDLDMFLSWYLELDTLTNHYYRYPNGKQWYRRYMITF